MKKKYTFRFEETEVNIWKKQAQKQNRSLTNYIETTLNNIAIEKLTYKKNQAKSRA